MIGLNGDFIVLSFLTLMSPNMETTLPAYEALGLRFVRERHGEGPEHYCCVSAGVAFEIYPGQKEVQEAGVLLGFDVDDLNAVRAALGTAGVSILRDIADIDGVASLIFADHDGRRVMVRQNT